MNANKEFYGYRYSKYKTNSGYVMHSIQVYFMEPLNYSGPSGRLYSTDLFTVEMQSGRDYNDRSESDPTQRPLLVNAYGLRIEGLKITHRAAYKALRPFSDIVEFPRSAREVIKALCRLKAVKVVYNSKESSFLPARFKRMQEAYFAAKANGLKVS